jgi:hypothetical protein
MLHGCLIPVIPSYHVAGIGPQNMSCGIVFRDTVLKNDLNSLLRVFRVPMWMVI